MKLDYKRIEKIGFVCSAGIGASAMGAAVMKKVIDQLGLDITVDATSLVSLSDEYDLIITHRGFKSAVEKRGYEAQIVYVDNYLDKKKFEEIGIGIKDAK